MSDNSAVIKIITEKTREYNELLIKHNALMVVHTKTVNDFAELDLKAYELRKDKRELRKLLDMATNDCKVAQESLDGAQREIEKLNGVLKIYNDELEGI